MNGRAFEPQVASDRAMRFYDDNIKHRLTDGDKGRYIAIDAKSGAWVIGDSSDADTTTAKLRAKVPDAHPFLIRHILIATDSMGGGFAERIEWK